MRKRTFDRTGRTAVNLTIETRVPEKWRFVDLETGQIWMWDGSKGPYAPASDIVVDDALHVHPALQPLSDEAKRLIESLQEDACKKMGEWGPPMNSVQLDPLDQATLLEVLEAAKACIACADEILNPPAQGDVIVVLRRNEWLDSDVRIAAGNGWYLGYEDDDRNKPAIQRLDDPSDFYLDMYGAEYSGPYWASDQEAVELVQRLADECSLTARKAIEICIDSRPEYAEEVGISDAKWAKDKKPLPDDGVDPDSWGKGTPTP